MDLEQLHTLPASDKWIFVRGRIVSEAVSMDAALRGVHAALRGRDDRDALLDGSAMWSNAVKECRQLLEIYSPLDDEMRAAIHSALDSASAAWDMRNRYMHDLLSARIDDPAAPAKQRADDDRYRLRLTRQQNAPEVDSVSLNDAINLVQSIVAALWRLRAARQYLRNGSWRSMLLAHVEGDWDGNAGWVSPDDE